MLDDFARAAAHLECSLILKVDLVLLLLQIWQEVTLVVLTEFLAHSFLQTFVHAEETPGRGEEGLGTAQAFEVKHFKTTQPCFLVF